MRRNLVLSAWAGLVALSGCAGAPPAGWCTPPDAYKMWREDPAGVRIVDVRTPEEYIFNGHPVMARNIPSRFLGVGYDANRHAPVTVVNPHFLEDVRQACKPEDTVVVMGASGPRGEEAAELLRRNGFAKVLNVEGGFDGQYKQECACQGKGELLKRGWQQHGLPWSTWINPDLLYHRDRGLVFGPNGPPAQPQDTVPSPASQP